jgi:hypothetical protein
VTEISDGITVGMGIVGIEIRLTPDTTVYDVGGNPNGRYVSGIVLRTSLVLPRADCLKVNRGRAYLFDATVRDFEPDTRLLDNGVTFRNARLIAEHKKPPGPPFDTKVLVEQLDPKTGKVRATAAGVDALRDGGKWTLRASHLTFIIRKADRITAADKSVWIVRVVIATGQGEDKLFVCDTEPAK